MLKRGLATGDVEDEDAQAIEAHARTGRPRDDDAFLEVIEASTGRTLKPGKTGRKRKSEKT